MAIKNYSKMRKKIRVKMTLLANGITPTTQVRQSLDVKEKCNNNWEYNNKCK